MNKPDEETYRQPSNEQKLRMYLGFLLYLAGEYDRNGDHTASEVLMAEANNLKQRLSLLETYDLRACS